MGTFWEFVASIFGKGDAKEVAAKAKEGIDLVFDVVEDTIDERVQRLRDKYSYGLIEGPRVVAIEAESTPVAKPATRKKVKAARKPRAKAGAK